MPTFYNFKQDGNTHSFDDVFIPVDAFRQGNLWTWGRNVFGQAGTNDTSYKSTPVTTLSGGSNWKQVECGYQHSLAIKTDGTLWTWGYGANLQLGTGDNQERRTPVQVFGNHTNWKQVSVGVYVTAAIKTDGTLWVWGEGSYGGLGTNDTTSRATPVTTFAGGTNWKQVSTGALAFSAIKTDGTLWTWGLNDYGALGTNDTATRSTPVTTFAGGTNWKQVACGEYHFSAIKTDGTLWTWGSNGAGELGINDTTHRSTPVTTFAGGTNWKQSSNGFGHTTAIKTDGTLWTWGTNYAGGLGTNDTTNRATPVTTIAGGTNWKKVHSGNGSNAAIKTDGTLWTWGYNSFASLGINDHFNRSTPVTTFAGGTNWKSVAIHYQTLAIEYIDPVL